ncbi:FAD-binding protein [bacterium]|nr:MAG: FAD-binding protein [bacterium]
MFGDKGTLILGAGPAGMAAALELHKAGQPFIVIEKNERVGGLAKTFDYGGFRTDVGPHRFFSQNKYLYALIGGLLGDRWIKVDRLTRFYIKGKYLLYPVKLNNAFWRIGPLRTTKIFCDYLTQRTRNLFVKRKPASFQEQIIADFGESLARLNIINYTEKVWGLPCTDISADWARQRIKGLSLREIIKNAFIKSKHQPKTLIDQFYYPDTGTGLIYEKMRERILANPSAGRQSIMTGCFPMKIIHDDNKINEVILNNNGDRLVYQPENVVSSIPINEMVELLDPKPPVEILEAAGNLRFRSHVSLFLILTKSSVFKDQWIYFPDQEIPFGRIMEPKNFSAKMSLPDKTSLLIEFFCWEKDAIWNSSRERLTELSIGWLNKLGFLHQEEIGDSYLHKEKYAYPLYDLNYKKWLGIVKAYLHKLSNLQLIGRGGCFRYNNQDHALEMGIVSARNIINNRKDDIEEVGAAQVYFEQGYSR